MLLRKLLFSVFFFSALWASGNNLSLGNSVRVTSVTSSQVTFEVNVSWSNSWSDGFNNDAVWLFFKYRRVDGNWSHLYLNGQLETSDDYSILTGSSAGDLTGLFLFRSSSGSGNASCVCKITWDYSGSGLTADDFQQNKIFFMAQGIEMVFLPFGSFPLGDATSAASFISADGTPVSITGDGSEQPIELHTLGGTNPSVSLTGTYPSGFSGFYIMKYELSQEQYIAFVNTLSRSEQLQLLPQLSSLTKGQYLFGSPDRPDNRNGIVVSVPLSAARSAVLDNNLTNDDKFGNGDDGRTLACNYMSISDLLAYTAWSGLRPLTETEYEKTCRRLLPQLPLSQEYAWGTTALTPMDAIVSETAGWNNETPNSGNVNALGRFGIYPGSGPVRCGAFAAVATNRSEAGSTFSGVMEMSGNLSELCINASRYSVTNFDGTIHGSGQFSLSEWGRGIPSSFGIRGGSFSSEKEELRVSDRSQADNNYLPSLTVRDSSVGFRGVRMLDPSSLVFNAGTITLDQQTDVICSGAAFTLRGTPAQAFGITGLTMHYSWYMDGQLLVDEQGKDLSFPIGIFNRETADKTFNFRREVNCAVGTFSASFSLTVPGKLRLSLPDGVSELQLSCNASSAVTASRTKSSSFRWVNGTTGTILRDWSTPATESAYTPLHKDFGYVGAQRKLRCVSDMGGCRDSIDINLFILPSCGLALDKPAISMSSNTDGETVTASLCGPGEVSWYYKDDSNTEHLLSSAVAVGDASGSSYTNTYKPKYADFKNTIGTRTVIVRSQLGDNIACQDKQELPVSVSATLNPGSITAPVPAIVCGNSDVIISNSQNAVVDGMNGLTPTYQWFVSGSSTPLPGETASGLKYRLPANTGDRAQSYTFVRKAFTSSPALQSGGSNTVTVTVPGVPSVTIGAPGAVCDGQNLTLPATNINWAGLSGTGTWSLGGVAVPSPVKYANNGQKLLYTISNTCHASVKSNEVAITVRPLPVGRISGGGSVCPGSTANVSLSFSSGTVPYYYTVTGAGEASSNNVSFTLPKLAGTYYLTVLRDANGCVATSRTGSATVSEITPTVQSAGNIYANPAEVCTGGGFTLTNGGDGYGNCGYGVTAYNWYRSDGVYVGSGVSLYLDGYANGTYYFYRQACLANGQCANTGNIAVTVKSCGPSDGSGTIPTGVFCDGKTWMLRNLNDASKGGQCYENNAAYCATDGRLYTWNEALSACPSGWHLPTDAEFNTLNACLKNGLISTWQPQYAGYWDSLLGSWGNRGSYGGWWTSTEGNSTSAYRWNVFTGDTSLTRSYNYKTHRYSVRCVK